jgi:hypothetical protein
VRYITSLCVYLGLQWPGSLTAGTMQSVEPVPTAANIEQFSAVAGCPTPEIQFSVRQLSATTRN